MIGFNTLSPSLPHYGSDYGSKGHDRSKRPLPFGQRPFMVGRIFWGAKKAQETIDREGKFKYVVFQSTKTNVCFSRSQCRSIIQRLQNEQMAFGAKDIYYNFLVTGCGTIYKCRGWYHEPEFPNDDYKEILPSALNIGFVGDFDGRDKNPPNEMMYAAINIIKTGIVDSSISPSFQLIPLTNV